MNSTLIKTLTKIIHVDNYSVTSENCKYFECTLVKDTCTQLLHLNCPILQQCNLRTLNARMCRFSKLFLLFIEGYTVSASFTQQMATRSQPVLISRWLLGLSQFYSLMATPSQPVLISRWLHRLSQVLLSRENGYTVSASFTQ